MVPMPQSFTVKFPDRAMRTVKIHTVVDTRRSPVAKPPYSPPRLATADPSPSPFAAINYRDPLLVHHHECVAPTELIQLFPPQTKITVPVSAPILSPSPPPAAVSPCNTDHMPPPPPPIAPVRRILSSKTPFLRFDFDRSQMRLMKTLR